MTAERAMKRASTRRARMRDLKRMMRRKRKRNPKKKTRVALPRRRKMTVCHLLPMLPMMPAIAMPPGSLKALAQS